MIKKTAQIVMIGLVVALMVFLFLSFVLQMAWNYSLVDIFPGLKPITYAQALILYGTIRILFPVKVGGK